MGKTLAMFSATMKHCITCLTVHVTMQHEHRQKTISRHLHMQWLHLKGGNMLYVRGTKEFIDNHGELSVYSWFISHK